MSYDDEAAMVRITGRVQGVGFRAWTREEAEQLGLTGWVRNEPDRSVLALIAGSPAGISQMLERFRHGPPGAAVSSVERQPATLAEKPIGFRITK
ncbi:acylphosphatase [Neorhizobium galegae]|uniref:acylphosphatase n=1 Tax=Neorhizobium galegae TaxID=399 RepID=UPI002786905D|nr:acylphosphatase [Neorhizobium galegae]MDQ0133197.1 acylphosphatase [Neorhizobium galegae]